MAPRTGLEHPTQEPGVENLLTAALLLGRAVAALAAFGAIGAIRASSDSGHPRR